MSLGSQLLGQSVRLTLSGILALCLGVSALSAEPIVINEIMYHSKLTEWKEDDSAEYIELYHAGEKPISLESWKFASGVRFNFPAVTLEPGGYLVVAADPEALKAKHPSLKEVLGPYRGKLSNGGEKITLEDADEKTVDEVTYSDGGRWAQRVSTRLKGYPDWVWRAAHDGRGKSLALKSPQSKNEFGEHWASSEADGGTPGIQNDVYTEAISPVVLSIEHTPAIPKPGEDVVVTATVDHASDVTLTLMYRLDGGTTFQSVPLRLGRGASPEPTGAIAFDSVPMIDGKGTIPGQKDKVVVQFYVVAKDAAGLSTEYPKLNRDESGKLTLRQPVCLFQVDATFDQDAEQAPGAKPTYRIITTSAEIAMMKKLAGMSGRSNVYDNHLHLTFIAVDGMEVDVRYNVTARIRGHGSRSAFPPGMRVSFPSDEPWRGVTDINLNTQFTHSQSIGAAVHQLLGSHSAASTPVVVEMNGTNWAKKGSPQYGCYVHNEVLDSAFVDRHFPGEDGNLYRLVSRAYLNEQKSDSSFRTIYNKRNNGSEDDYDDMVKLIETLRETSPEETYFDRVNEIADLEQWAHYIALDTLLCNTEGGMPQGRGDDVAMFRRQNGRFQFIPYDLDSILGMGDDGQRLSQDVFGYGNMAGLRALFQNPKFLKLYTDSIIRLTETTYRPEIIHRLIDEQWSGWIPEKLVRKVKDFSVARIDNVLSQIRSSTVIASTLEKEGDFYKASSPSFALYGRFDHRNVSSVDVGGLQPKVFPETGMWILPPDRLKEIVRAGMNQIPVLMLNAEGDIVDEELMRVWMDTGEVKRVSGTLPENQTITWTAEEGPYLLDGELVIPLGTTLEIQGGTTVYGENQARIRAKGDLKVLGEASKRVTFSRNPSGAEGQGWEGLSLANVTDASSIENADFFDLDGPLEIKGGKFKLANVSIKGGAKFTIQGICELSVHGSAIEQGESSLPVFGTSGDVTLEHTKVYRSGPGAMMGGEGQVHAFACTFEQAEVPVIKMTGGVIDACDFKVATAAEGAVVELLGSAGFYFLNPPEDADPPFAAWRTTVYLTRNRAAGKTTMIGVENATNVSRFSNREVQVASPRFLKRPPMRTSLTQGTLEVGGPGLAAFRYQINDQPWSEPMLLASGPKVWMMEAYSLDYDLEPGLHVIRLLGQHVSGRWQSEDDALTSYSFEIVPGLPSVVINEVLAVNESAHKLGDGEFDDLIELHNVGESPVDLSAFALSDDPDEAPKEPAFPEGTMIAAGGYEVVAASKKRLGFALSGSGDAVYLWHNGEVIDNVVFGLQLADHSVSRIENGDWALSKPTLGASNSVLPLGDAKALRFTEWLAIPDMRSSDEFLELANTSSLPVDLSGMTITDRMPNRSVWKPLPRLSFISADSRQVFVADGSPKDGADHLDFRLGNEGEAIGLFDREGRMVDFVIYGPQATGVSQGRSEDGTLVFAAPSPGSDVASPASALPELVTSLRISELHYHPSVDEDEEFVELVNVGPQAVSLDSVAFVGGIEHTFADLTLAPGARGVVVKDRQAFRKRYGMEITIVGEYKGKLSNGGERLSLATASGDVVVEFDYSDKWHKSTDGKGYSLSLTDLQSTRLDSKKAWQPSDVIGGTPGK